MKGEIKKKIRKLLALARKAGTEAEAASAMDKVHKLLLRHNLSLNDVDVREYDMVMEPIIEGTDWCMPIWAGVATLYFSKYLMSVMPPKHIIIGQPDNLIIIRETIRQLVQVCNDLSIRFADKAKEHLVPMATLNGVTMIKVPNLFLHESVDSFRRGFAMRVNHRCMAEVKRTQAEGAVSPDVAEDGPERVIGTALVVKELYEAEATRVASFLADAGIGYEQKAMDIQAPDHDAFRSGFDAGSEVALNQKFSLK